MAEGRKCWKCGGTGFYGFGYGCGDGHCYTCRGTGVIKPAMAKYTEMVTQCATQESLDVYLNESAPYIKNAEHRAEVVALIERIRPTLVSQAWLNAEDVEGYRERRDARRARTAEWEARRQAEKAAQ